MATRGSVDYRCALSLLLLDAPSVKYAVNAGSILPAQRDELANELEGDWLLFIDDDMVVPTDTLTRLLDHGVDIVGGLAFRRNPPYLPCIARWNADNQVMETVVDVPRTGLVEVGGIGMGCTLIRRRVFETLAAPRFAHRGGLGEDYSFCLLAAEAGFKIYCDTSLVIGHVASVVVDDRFYTAAMTRSPRSPR